MSEISVDPGLTLHVAQSDVKDYFYRLGIPELKDYFCLLDVTVGELKRSWGFLPVGLPAEPSAVVHPCLQAVPQGFSWAFWLAQRVHDKIASEVLP